MQGAAMCERSWSWQRTQGGSDTALVEEEAAEDPDDDRNGPLELCGGSEWPLVEGAVDPDETGLRGGNPDSVGFRFL